MQIRKIVKKTTRDSIEQKSEQRCCYCSDHCSRICDSVSMLLLVMTERAQKAPIFVSSIKMVVIKNRRFSKICWRAKMSLKKHLKSVNHVTNGLNFRERHLGRGKQWSTISKIADWQVNWSHSDVISKLSINAIICTHVGIGLFSPPQVNAVPIADR